MSVPAFTDITVEEQTSAIRSYLKNLNASIAEENSDDGFERDLHHIISCCDACFDKGTDAETESVFNSIVSLLVTVPAEKSENLVVSFCEKLAKAPNNKLALVSLRVLSNLFQGLDDCSTLRFNVYYYMVKVAGVTGSVLAVFTDVDKMKRWMKQCDVSTDKLQRILRLLHEILLAGKQSELASKVMVELLSTYTEDNASQARDEAHRCIVASLGDPNIFLLDHLLTLKPVKFLEGELIHDLLTIFVSEKLSAYIKFYNANKEFVDSLGLRHNQSMQKMMLLTFMQIAETRKEIPYEVLQQELQIGADGVEMFVIDALRTKMIMAKVDQLNRRVVVSTTIHRTFGKPQWQLLREVLVQWKAGVARVDENMENVLGQFTEQASISTTATV